MSNPVEGWYPDPAGTAQLRWWDGYSWTADYLPDDTVQDSVPQARPKAPATQLATTVILSLLVAAFTVGAIATTSLFLSANKEYKQAEQTLNQANEDLQTVQGESK